MSNILHTFASNLVLTNYSSMKEEYYVPQIDEFRIGFEYEVKDMQSVKSQLNDGITYSTEKVDLSMNLKGMTMCLSRGEIRVKYLDEDDLIELGWTLDTNYYNDVGELVYTKEGYQIIIWKSRHVRIRDKNIPTVIFFEGKILNKSELKVLMNQIGILWRIIKKN